MNLLGVDAPIILVKWEQGTWRMCVYYFCLNKVATKNLYSLLRAYGLIDRMHSAWYFTKIDIWRVYHQTRFVKEDILKPHFIRPMTILTFSPCHSVWLMLQPHFNKKWMTFFLIKFVILSSFSYMIFSFVAVVWITITLLFVLSCKHCKTNVSLPKLQTVIFSKDLKHLIINEIN